MGILQLLLVSVTAFGSDCGKEFRHYDFTLQNVMDHVTPLVHRYGSLVLRLKREDVEDAVQDLHLFGLVEGPRLYREREWIGWTGASNYMSIVGKRFLYQIMRKKGRRYQQTEPFIEMGGLATNPLTILVSREREELVREAIETLSPNKRKVVQLFYFEKVPYEEIARMLGISPVTVRTRLRRARRDMAEYFAQKHETEALREPVVSP